MILIGQALDQFPGTILEDPCEVFLSPGLALRTKRGDGPLVFQTPFPVRYWGELCVYGLEAGLAGEGSRITKGVLVKGDDF